MNSTAKTSRVYKRLIESAKLNDRRVHITSRSNGWAVKKEGNVAATTVLPTQIEAIEYARYLVSSGKASRIVVHRKDGRIRK